MGLSELEPGVLSAAELQGNNSAILESTLRSSRECLLAQAQKHARLPDDAEEALQSACALFIERFNPRYRPLP
jgi:hypothetical protein